MLDGNRSSHAAQLIISVQPENLIQDMENADRDGSTRCFRPTAVTRGHEKLRPKWLRFAMENLSHQETESQLSHIN